MQIAYPGENLLFSAKYKQAVSIKHKPNRVCLRTMKMALLKFYRQLPCLEIKRLVKISEERAMHLLQKLSTGAMKVIKFLCLRSAHYVKLNFTLYWVYGVHVQAQESINAHFKWRTSGKQ